MTLELSAVLEALEEIAPLALAADWDNAGLLVEPSRADRVAEILLAIDLSDAVLGEAIASGCGLVVAYHPPIFAGLRALRQVEFGERRIVKAIEAGIAVYSPHTALDAVPGGVDDWLAEAFAPARTAPIEPSTASSAPAGSGHGRSAELATPVAPDAALARVKGHLGLERLRWAPAPRHRGGGRIERVAVCAGAGASVLMATRGVDLWLTGEMRHHDIIAANAAGTSVVLTEHSNSERGYLPRLARRMRDLLPELAIRISTEDADPLSIV